MDVPFKLKNTIKTIIPDVVMTYRLSHRFSNSILLTFDDGPDEKITIQVLRRLKYYKVKAVFFVVGMKAVQYPNLLKLIHEDGHIVGLHTCKHHNRVITSAREYWREIIECQSVVNRIIGIKSKLVRPPLGLSFASLITPIFMNKRTVLWSIESGEWGINKHDSEDSICQRLENEMTGRDILLMHDNNKKIIPVLDRILPFLKRKGFDLEHGIKYFAC